MATELDQLWSFYSSKSPDFTDHFVVFSLGFVALFAVVEPLEFVDQATLLVKQVSCSLPSLVYLFLILLQQSYHFVFLR